MVPLAEQQAGKKRRLDEAVAICEDKMAMSSDPSLASSNGIDTNLYSRQLGAYGFEAMGRLIKMKTFISGINGTGAEIAKNLILAGPQVVCLHDDSIVQMRDLGANFYLKESDVGCHTLADASFKHLVHLNQYVQTCVHKGPVTQDVLKQFDVVVFTGTPRAQLMEINDFCRSQTPPIGFICCECFGLAVSVFVDFGNEFSCFDINGEEPKSAIVAGVTYENPATVHVNNDKLMPFQDGDYVVFRELQGMRELNDQPPMPIKVIGKHCFTIGDTTKFHPYSREGLVSQKKVPVKLRFKSYRESCLQPVAPGQCGLETPDLAKCGRPEQLHFATQALQTYRDNHGCLPGVGDEAATTECLEIARRLNADAKGLGDGAVSVEEVCLDVVKHTTRFASCVLSPVAAFVGGIVAQEVVKFTGKFGPLRQWLYLDFFESLPLKEPSDRQPINSRYDDQIAIWGRQFQTKLANLKLFVVGAGALGCEFMKMFALMGCCCGENGKLTITDMDRIETSNLNRQFLFHKEHVGMPKSSCAAVAAIEMNPSLRVDAKEIRVCQESENIFDDPFWESQDLIVNALDNIQARQYVDSRCVWYLKPLLESGTLGTKGNVQVVLPRMTQSYSDSQDPPEESIPLCTLKHFPHAIEHTLEWARDLFEGLFTGGPQEALGFVSDPSTYMKKLRVEGTPAVQRERLEKVKGILVQLKVGKRFEGAVEKAVKLFHQHFYSQIQQLLYTFPLDHLTTSGSAFWSGPKRPPTPLTFDIDEHETAQFVLSAANLFAFNLGIPQCDDVETIKKMAQAVSLEPFQPKSMRIKVDERDQTVEGAGDDDLAVERLEVELLAMAAELGSKIHVSPVEFEKDDDSNYHVDFIASCANLRARNYKIEECDRHKAKMIAGKIIPAIATTTAMVSGLVGLEALKIVDYAERKLEDFKNAFINLALPLWLFSEPLPAIKTVDKDFDVVSCGPVRAKPYGFTTWDKLHINIPGCTVKKLNEELATQFNVNLSILAVGNKCIYNSFLPAHEKNNLLVSIATLVKNATKSTGCGDSTDTVGGRNYVVLDASCYDITDKMDVIIPVIRLQF